MNDPHVERLHYKLRTGEGLSFNSPPPIDEKTAEFRVRLEDDSLTAEMKEHHATEQSARKRVDAYLRSWEVQTNLRLGRGSISFEFVRSEIIDRNPPRPGDPQTTVAGTGIIMIGAFSCSASGHAVHSTFPPAPSRFRATPDVEMMLFRYEMSLDAKEPILSMAFACLTFLEGSTGATTWRRRDAAGTTRRWWDAAAVGRGGGETRRRRDAAAVGRGDEATRRQ
jgi:hypothetical protein